MAPVWIMPQGAGAKKRAKMWLDFQNDVKVSDVQLAAREGYESVEHTKRYTTLGMATDQGKLSNINGLAMLSDALNAPIPQVGTTTFRPPFTPISMGAIAGEARGPVFQPLRRTPIHACHEEAARRWEPVGHWRRPYCFPRRARRSVDAVNREITATRESLGPARRLHARQDPREGAGCGPLHGHALHQHDEHAETGALPLRADVLGERLPDG
jgi:sarcosine oxidase subunit alpha